MGRFRRHTDAGAEPVALIDVDAELAEGLTDEQAAAAREGVRVKAEWVPPGPLSEARVRRDEPGTIVLLARGLVARTTTFEDAVVAELVCRGGFIWPHTPRDQARLALRDYRIELAALETSLLASLGPEALRALAGFPELGARLLRRCERHVAELEALRVIGQVTGVERRLLAFFRLLAARQGRDTSEGVAVPVAMPHRMLADLVGARRPTVSTALRQLADAGELRRLHDGTWLLPGATVADVSGRSPAIS